MAEQVGKFLTELPELETPTDDDAMYIVDGSTASKKITMANLKRVLGGNVTGTVEGASVSFSDGADGIPMEECEVTIVPTQDLHGYSKPWAGGAGKNKLPVTITTATVGTIVFTNNDGVVSISGTFDQNHLIIISDSVSLKAGTYILTGCPSGGGYSSYVLRFETSGGSAYAVDTGNGATFTLAEDVQAVCRIYIYSADAIGKTFYPMIRESTAPSGFEPYSNICPISGHTDVTVTVASTSGGSGEDTTVSLGRTVYGGTLDVTTGVLTVTHTFLTPTEVSSTGTSGGLIYYAITGLNAPSDNEADLISSHFKSERTVAVGNAYIAGYGSILVIVLDQSITTVAQANAWLVANNPQFCYKLATPQTFNLTPTQVKTLLGQNYVSHDGGGNIKVVYIRDLDIVINDLINRVTALENE